MKKRIKKKLSRPVETEAPKSPKSMHEQVVTVPCPGCAHPTMHRRYIPAVGNMNGMTSCPRCKLEAPYVDVLANAMVGEDPLPELIALPAVRQIRPIEMLSPETGFTVWMAWFQRTFANALGIRRRWRFA